MLVGCALVDDEVGLVGAGPREAAHLPLVPRVTRAHDAALEMLVQLEHVLGAW